MPESLDQSQRAAEAVPSLDAKTLLQKLRQSEAVTDESADADIAAENRKRAADEATLIFELKNSRAFQWFEEEFIDKAFQDAREAYHSEFTNRDNLADARMKYLTLKSVKAGLLEREIAHRTTMNPEDSELPRLRERITLL